ncbi:hypothetical protein D3C81_1525190 [compost metagenome]
MLQLLGFTEHAAGSFQHQAASGRELHAVGFASEQGQAAALLDQAQPGAGGRYGHRKGGGGLAQAAVGGDGGQQAQVLKVEVHRVFSKTERLVLEKPILADVHSVQNNALDTLLWTFHEYLARPFAAVHSKRQPVRGAGRPGLQPQGDLRQALLCRRPRGCDYGPCPAHGVVVAAVHLVGVVQWPSGQYVADPGQRGARAVAGAVGLLPFQPVRLLWPAVHQCGT